MAHFTFECLQRRFLEDAPAAMGEAVAEHRLANLSRMNDAGGSRLLQQRPRDVELYYAVTVREENTVGTPQDGAAPATQLTTEAWLFTADAAVEGEYGFEPYVGDEYIPVFTADEDTVSDTDRKTRKLTQTAGYFHLARKVTTVPVAGARPMYTDRLIPLIDSLVRYCAEDANVRVCNYGTLKLTHARSRSCFDRHRRPPLVEELHPAVGVDVERELVKLHLQVGARVGQRSAAWLPRPHGDGARLARVVVGRLVVRVAPADAVAILEVVGAVARHRDVDRQPVRLGVAAPVAPAVPIHRRVRIVAVERHVPAQIFGPLAAREDGAHAQRPAAVRAVPREGRRLSVS